ncbi:MAG: 30S ribosome-binding factor RbfA [Planctomycetota bacterium]
MKVRAQRMASVIARAIQGVLNDGLADPRLAVLITVTSVTIDDDLTVAVVRVTVSPERKAKTALHGLSDAAAHIRRRVGDATAIKRVPTLMFKFDDGTKSEAAVLDALAEVRAEQETPRSVGWGAARQRAQDTEEGTGT